MFCYVLEEKNWENIHSFVLEAGTSVLGLRNNCLKGAIDQM